MNSKGVMDCETEQSRGFGFVEFAYSQTVDTILGQRKHSIDGQLVKVNTAKAKASDSGGGRGSGGYRGRGGGGYGGGGYDGNQDYDGGGSYGSNQGHGDNQG